MQSPDDDIEVEVFGFLVPLPNHETPSLSPFKATRQAIAQRFGGQVLESTGQRVSGADLDGEGRYRRLPTGWGDL